MVSFKIPLLIGIKIKTMKKITVNLRKYMDDSYDIVIGKDITGDLTEFLSTKIPAHSYAIITDSNVEELYGRKLYDNIKSHLPVVELISFPAGEQNKNRHYKEMIEDIMLAHNFGRDSAVIAVGGGVVGDMSGFVAATYCRGIPHIQLPTSLVACVDSSVGGKTAVDTPHGKNLIGAFHQPLKVIIDISTLGTLPGKEMQEGMAEVIKYGVIDDSELFSIIEKNIDDIYNHDTDILTEIIERSCRIKAQVVEQDEKETDLRKILNYGHTIGHAIENLSSYRLSHGRAISIGMVLEALISVKIGYLGSDSAARIKKLIEKAELPTELTEKIDPEMIINTMKLDKKSRKGAIEMALPSDIGNMKRGSSGYGIKVEEDIIREVLSSYL